MQLLYVLSSPTHPLPFMYPTHFPRTRSSVANTWCPASGPPWSLWGPCPSMRCATLHSKAYVILIFGDDEPCTCVDIEITGELSDSTVWETSRAYKAVGNLSSMDMCEDKLCLRGLSMMGIWWMHWWPRSVQFWCSLQICYHVSLFFSSCACGVHLGKE